MDTFAVVNPKNLAAGEVIVDSISWPAYQAAGWERKGAPSPVKPKAHEPEAIEPPAVAPEAEAPAPKRRAARG